MSGIEATPPAAPQMTGEAQAIPPSGQIEPSRGRVRLRTLTRIRWVAIAGQLGALFLVLFFVGMILAIQLAGILERFLHRVRRHGLEVPWQTASGQRRTMRAATTSRRSTWSGRARPLASFATWARSPRGTTTYEQGTLKETNHA